MKVGRAIKILRESNAIQLGVLAEMAGISAAMLSMIERGTREPSIESLRRVADALKIPVDVLFAAAQPGEGTLVSTNERANGFASALRRLDALEEELRQMSSNEELTQA